MVIEVLSPSTEANDRGKKFILYRNITSLEEYILINPQEYFVERYYRQDKDQWLFTSYKGEDAKIEFSSIDFSGTLINLYEDVVFEQQKQEA